MSRLHSNNFAPICVGRQLAQAGEPATPICGPQLAPIYGGLRKLWADGGRVMAAPKLRKGLSATARGIK